MAGKQVFLVGPGFIGWNILDILISEGYSVTALCRRSEHAADLEASGANAVLGSLSDHGLIRQRSASSDIVFQCATGDDLPLERAILSGVHDRSSQGKSTLYVHTSGAKVFDDGAKGRYESTKIYHDNVRAEMDSVPDDAPHRDVDLFLVRAQEELKDHLRLAIMLPPEVYGYDAKHDRLSLMIPKMTRFALKHGYAPVIGEGKSVETQIHVMDCARAYVAVMHYLERASQEEALANPYWLCENGKEFAWREAAEVIGKALVERGMIASPTPKNPPRELYGELSGERTESYMGLNCRAQAVRLRELGWECKEKGIWESYLEDELDVILQRYPSK